MMRRLTRTQQKTIVDQWKRAAPALANARDTELRQWQYDPATVDALLEIGAQSPPRDNGASGLVEMQRLFMQAARKQGLLPTAVREAPRDACHNASGAEQPLYVAGDAALLSRPKLALFCSVKCPGKLIVDTYDLARHCRNAGLLVISPFHSPMEQECLRILLRSPHPILWCLARGMYRQMPSSPVDCRPAAAAGRLVLVSPFPPTITRITRATALARNQLTVQLADAVVIAHAAPGSKMETLAHQVLAAAKPLYTFDHPANASLLASGARRIVDGELLFLLSVSGRGGGI